MSDALAPAAEHKPYVPDEARVAEFTPKAVIVGAFFGLIFGASTVYLALKAGLTVSASIPIAVLSISLLKKLGGSTILENNIVQTIGSAGESIAAGVVFTLPGFLFLAIDPTTHQSVGAPYFSYWTIFTLALLGGMLGVLMMVPLRRALIVKEHGNLPYPEGAACAQVLIAGEQGGEMARTAYLGLFFAFAYATLQKIFHVIAETPAYVTRMTSKIFPAATLNADITPEYMGVGYIIGPRIAGVLVAGGVLAWLGIIPLIASIVPGLTIAGQLVKLGYLADIGKAGAFGWDPATQTFAALNNAIYRAYVRQIGAGAVAAGGFITLLKTLPTIVAAFKGSVASLRSGVGEGGAKRTEQDLPITVVVGGSIGLVLIMAFLPFLPGNFGGRLVLGVLIVVFGFFFVTVASRIVGIIGTSSNPVSGMTIATLMATCLLFVGIGWTGDFYQPMALCVGGMVCIAAANAGATSQDLKTGFLVGATPKAQQIGLIIGAVAAAAVIGITMRVLDIPTADAAAKGITHMIGTERYPAPQGTLMATLIRGLLAHNLDWQFVLVGVFLAITVELCGVSPLSFAVGAYLPLSTTLPIFVGGAIKGIVDRVSGARGGAHGEDLGPGSLFATGLVAGGALAGVLVAILSVNDNILAGLDKVDLAHALTRALGEGGYMILGVIFFAVMGAVLYKVARKPFTSPSAGAGRP
jgi:OPT family oligopeptide transporter